MTMPDATLTVRQTDWDEVFAERDRLREQNAALLLALEKIRAAYTRSTNKFAVQTLDAMDEIAQQAIAAAERKP